MGGVGIYAVVNLWLALTRYQAASGWVVLILMAFCTALVIRIGFYIEDIEQFIETRIVNLTTAASAAVLFCWAHSVDLGMSYLLNS